MRIGIECGGTFTDVVATDDHGEIVATAKVFSTPEDPSKAVRAGLAELDDAKVAGSDLLHGSTVATNAVLERKGGPVALIATRGFKDIVFLQRQDRSTMYDLNYVKPEPLVSREAIIEVNERISVGGEIVLELEQDAVRETIQAIRKTAPAAVAISLLHAYANPAHELQLANAIRKEFPELPISLSHEVAREFREYERTTTTVVDAFIRPMVSSYLGRLRLVASESGIESLGVMQSNGGIVTPEVVVAKPVSMLMSGPAAGVSGAVTIGARSGLDQIVTMDMGGTSTDVAFVRDGEPDLASETVIDGLPLRVPLVDIHTVGAGGGSIISIDAGGLLTVGPKSAGADPGPACYGRGGTEPTITDANLIVGAMPDDSKLAGRFPLDKEAARQALEPIAEYFRVSVEQVASDAITLANAAMAGAIREVSLERGHEVGAATLIAYGGAGALHAADVAAQLNIAKVLVPPHAGLTSAYGLLTSRFQRDFAQTWFRDDIEQLDGNILRGRLDELRDEALADVAAYGIDTSAVTLTWHADLRYRGQGFELSTPLNREESISTIIARFHEMHARQYGHSSPGRAIQLVTLRVRVALPAPPTRGVLPDQEATTHSTVTLHLDGNRVEGIELNRAGIGTGIDGPAIITDVTATTLVPINWRASLDQHGNILLTRRDS
ncbi:MAG: hydantoinase/oxoprolinase family protein [Gulosibacter sp.]|uniref:hydantoinase/oxoprolinase family protein n=1 Tax=Gulosibacter sp. TaxID=2817531 RepID=UPI003F8F9A7F